MSHSNIGDGCPYHPTVSRDEVEHLAAGLLRDDALKRVHVLLAARTRKHGAHGAKRRQNRAGCEPPGPKKRGRGRRGGSAVISTAAPVRCQRCLRIGPTVRVRRQQSHTGPLRHQRHDPRTHSATSSRRRPPPAPPCVRPIYTPVRASHLHTRACAPSTWPPSHPTIPRSPWRCVCCVVGGSLVDVPGLVGA